MRPSTRVVTGWFQNDREVSDRRAPHLLRHRAAGLAVRELALLRAGDEELVAMVENNSCAVDAIQMVTGCTAGKGNLIFCDAISFGVGP